MSVGLHIFTEQIYNIYGGGKESNKKTAEQNKHNVVSRRTTPKDNSSCRWK